MIQFKIFYQVTLLIMCSFLFSCSEIEKSGDLSGFWISTEGKMIVEFADTYVVFKPFDKTQERVTARVETVDSKRFRIIGDGPDTSSVLTADWKAGVIQIALEFDQGGMIFKKAPNVQMNDILGTWYFTEKDDENNSETSEIITQKVFSYDHEYINVDHKSKTFSKALDLDVQSILRDGFIFTDAHTEGDFSYYITNYTQDTMTYINDDGYEWTQHRKENPRHIDIPEGYTEEAE